MSDVIESIRNPFPKLSRGKKKIAEFIMNNLEDIAYSPAAVVAQKSGMSESVVVRLAEDLGFSGYKEMQKSIQQSVMHRFRMADQFKHWMNSETKSPQGYGRVIERDIQNIKETFTMVDAQVLEQAAEIISQARHVGIVGIRGPLGPNTSFYVYLNQLLGNAFLITPGIGTSYDILKNWNEQDVLVVCGFLTSKKSFLTQTINYIKARKCRLIVITNNMISPLVEKADLILPVCIEGPFTSFVAVVSIYNCILFLIGKKRENHTLASIEEIDELLEREFYE